MKIDLAQSNATWAEDMALQRCNLSADPGAKTGNGIKPLSLIPPVFPTLRDWHQSEKPSRQDAAKSATGGHLPLTNTNPPKFHLPLNQDIKEKAVRHTCRTARSCNKSGQQDLNLRPLDPQSGFTPKPRIQKVLIPPTLSAILGYLQGVA